MEKVRKIMWRSAVVCLILVLLLPGGEVLWAEEPDKPEVQAEGKMKEETEAEIHQDPVRDMQKLSEQEEIKLEQVLGIPGIMDSLFPALYVLKDQENKLLDQLSDQEKQWLYDLLKYRFFYDIKNWNKAKETVIDEKNLESHAVVWCRWSKSLYVQKREENKESEKKLLQWIMAWYEADKGEKETEENKSEWSDIKEYEAFLQSQMQEDYDFWCEKLEACSQSINEQECLSELFEELTKRYLAKDDSIKEETEPEAGESSGGQEEEDDTADEDITENNESIEPETKNEEPSEEEGNISSEEVQNQSRIIAAIPGYESGKKEPFQIIQMTREEKKELKEKEELKVLTDPGGEITSIMVRWITEEDFLGTDKEEYSFTLKTEEDCVWSQPLKADYDEGRIIRKIVITDLEKEKKETEKEKKKEEVPKATLGMKIKEAIFPKMETPQATSVKAAGTGSWDAVNFTQMKTIFESYAQGYQIINVHIRGNISFREKLTVPAGKTINIISLGPSGSVNLTRAKGFTQSFFQIEKTGKLAVNKNTGGNMAGDLVLNGGAGSGYTSNGPIIINDGLCDIAPKTIVMRNKNIDKSLFGGGIYNNGTVTMDGAEFSNNASFHGGAIFNTAASEMTVKNSVISKNSTYVPSDYNEKEFEREKLFKHPNGGAIFNLGVLKISVSRIQNNTSRTKGGGILNYQENEKQKGRLEISGKDGKTIVSGNSSQWEGGGIYNCGGMKISDSSVNNNQCAKEGGGGILTDYNGRAEIINCTVSDNKAGGSGGGIFNWIGAKVTIRKCTVKGNQCDGSGGAGILIWENSVTSIQETTITENSTPHLGAGVLLYRAALTLSDGQISKNTAGEDAGGILVTAEASMTISGGTINGNTASNKAGGVYVTGSSKLKVTGGEITGNQADYGGGIFYDGAEASVSKGNIAQNTARQYGGGIYTAGKLQMGSQAVVEDNKAQKNSGGGIYVTEKAELTMDGTIIRRNTAAASGGGIHSYKGNIHMKKGSIANNTASQNGGGISANGGNVTFEGTAVNSNKAEKSGGGIADYGQASVVLRSAKVSGNSALNGKGIYVDAALTMSGLTQIAENNDVYLAAKRYVTIDEQMTLASGKAAVFTPDQYKLGRKIAEITYGKKLGSMEYIRADKSEKFGLTKKDNYILRAGDYQAKEALTKANEIVISCQFDITYQKNLDAEVKNIPLAGKKYWHESTVISEKSPSCSTAKFLGWSTKNDSSSAEIKPGTIYKDNKNLTLYAIWNTAPVITPGPPLEYWEGEVVTKGMLLEGVKAADKEDQKMGKELKIRIVKIEYADGRLKDGKKQPGEVKIWGQDMDEKELLDTWQMELDQADSPVIHTVTYAVKDSQGLQSEAKRQVKVKYNEFPHIKCEDRYFTLDEAKNGAVKEDVLLKDAMVQGIVDVTDDNNDILDPEHPIKNKIELIGFDETEFTEFIDSGYIKLSYAAEDSLGKQTVKEFTVYICKDGEAPEDVPSRYVRFINQKNYQKNLEKALDGLSNDELAKSQSNGGLRLDSYWYRKDEYRNILSSTLEEPKTKERYLFSREMTKNVKAYIEENGIGNTKRTDALSDFCARFLQ